MRIKGWYIEGFGHFTQAHRDNLAPGLAVIYGPNEAGKSTLLAFIRYMLFGFPPARGNEPLYRPQRGGNHGGRLMVEAEGHNYTIERTAGTGGHLRVTREDGLVLQDVAPLVGVADRAVFQRVFAFGLDELRSFDTLDHEAVRERIFSGGILGTGQSAQAMLRSLNDRRSALLAPRARSARINALLHEVQEKRTELDRARQAVRGYEALRQREDTLAAEVDTLSLEQLAATSRTADLEALAAIWQDFYDGQAAERELSDLEPIDAMPADAAIRLSAALTAVDGDRNRLAELSDQAGRCRAELEATQDDPDGLAAGASVMGALEQRALAAEWVEKANTARTRAKALETSIAATCATLGPDWDAARLATYDRSIARLEEVRSHEHTLAQTRSTLEQTRSRAVSAGEAAELQRGRVQALAGRLEAQAATSPEGLEHRRRVIAQLGGLILQSAAEHVGLEADARACHEAQAAVEEPGESGGRPAWITPAFLSLGLALAAIGIWRIALGEAAWSVAVLAGLIVAALPFLFTGGAAGAGLGGAKERLARATAAHAKRVTQLKALAEQIAALAREVGLPPAPEGHELERARQALAKDEALVSQRSELEKELSAAQQELATLVTRLEDQDSQAQAAEASQREAELAWKAWKAAAGVPEHLSAPGVIDVFTAIRQGQEEVRARDEAVADATHHEVQLHAFMAQVATLLKGLGLEPPTTMPELSTALEGARARCEAARVARHQREHLSRQLTDHEEAVQRAGQALATAEAALAALLTEAHATDEADFHRRAAIYEQRQALAARAGAATRAVDLRLGTTPRAAGLRAELAAADPDRWPREREALQLELERLNIARDQAIEQRRDAETARRTLELAADIPAIEGELETLRAGIAAAVREWRVLTLAESLISETLARFERERQPAVLARAGKLFGDVTEGVYPRLRQHDRGIVVVDRLEGEREAEALSRGTREQLYLCIRLGLCREFSSHSTSLPLVMDDVLVNFDAERAAAVGRLLLDVAREQQILLFTCQPHTRELLRTLDDDVQVVELPRYAGAQGPAPVPVGAPSREVSRVVSASVPTPDGALSPAAQTILSTIQAAAEPIGKARILEVSGVPEADWTQAVRELTERGLVVPDGQARGRVYTATEAARAEAIEPTPSTVR